jgi:hypothetical protein
LNHRDPKGQKAQRTQRREVKFVFLRYNPLYIILTIIILISKNNIQAYPILSKNPEKANSYPKKSPEIWYNCFTAFYDLKGGTLS